MKLLKIQSRWALFVRFPRDQDDLLEVESQNITPRLRRWCKKSLPACLGQLKSIAFQNASQGIFDSPVPEDADITTLSKLQLLPDLRLDGIHLNLDTPTSPVTAPRARAAPRSTVGVKKTRLSGLGLHRGARCETIHARCEVHTMDRWLSLEF